MKEKLLERKLRERVHQRGGMALKFQSPYFTGMPDRIVLLPGERVRFVEVKTTGQKPHARQVIVHKQLEKLGFIVDVVDDQDSLDNFLISI